ncbi:carboxymuconolactone decarboxylase family protein [Caenispirillum bisanense]|uniref:carboxymuconolactone decarboxylase family protein n=1 Tax=Caenispirillum bisanense TaxID=414052 RepID=UPI0031D84F88
MYKDWPQFATDVSGAMGELRKAAPEVMQAFSGLAKAATAEGVLSTKTKELIALGISVAIRCDGCIAFHARAAARYGATREEIAETLGMAVYMGGGPSAVYGGIAMEAFDQMKAEIDAKTGG